MRIFHGAAVCTVLAMMSLAAEQALNLRRQALEEASSLFHEALAKTKEDLAVKLGDTARDNTLAQHLAWRLSHSVRGTLESHLSSGQLDQIVLWTADGTETSKARDKDVTRPFEPGHADQVTDRYIWTSQTAVPELVLVRPLVGGHTTLYVAGHVTLNAAWLRHFPRFKEKMNRLGLAMTATSTDVTVLSKADESTKSPVLTSARTLDGWILNSHSPFGKSVVPTTWPTLFIAIALGLLGITQDKKRYAKIQHETVEFISWCAALNARTVDTASAKYHLQDGKRFIQRILAEKSCVEKDLRQEITTLTANIKKLDQELTLCRKQLIKSCQTQSLAMQATPLIDGFLDQAHVFDAAIDQATRKLHQSLLQPAKILHGVTQKWTRGIAERGSRKLIRSLAETEGTEPGHSALDDDLAVFATHSMATVAAGDGAVQTIKDLAVQCQKFVRLGERWEELTDKKGMSRPASSPLTALEEAQELMRFVAESHGKQMVFVNHPIEGAIPQLPKSDHGLWVSACFHLLQACESSTGTTKIVTRVRADKKHGLIVLQHSSLHTSRDRGTFRATQSEALELARLLLQGFGVTVQVLAQRDGTYPIAIRWPLPPSAVNSVDHPLSTDAKAHVRQNPEEIETTIASKKVPEPHGPDTFDVRRSY